MCQPYAWIGRGVRAWVVVFVLFGGAVTNPAAGQARPAGLTPAKAQALELVLYTPLNVDGGATTATTTLQLDNPNPTAVPYTLTIVDDQARNTRERAGWVVTFYGPDNKPVGPVLQGTAAARQSFPVRVDLGHVIEAGETTARLIANGEDIGELRLAKDTALPFRVTLEGDPAEKPVISIVNGTPVDLKVKNDDAMYYPLIWEVTIKGKTERGFADAGPNGITSFTVTPERKWFSVYQSFFRSETASGTVTLGYRQRGALVGAYPSKTIPITAKLDAWNPTGRDMLAIGVILVILIAGGWTSTYVHVDLVNRIKAIAMKKRLGQLSRSIGEIGPQLSSQLRVSLWLERGRILTTLPDRILFTPGIADGLAQSDTDTDALQQRVDLAGQIADASTHLDHAIDAGGVAPTLVDEINKKLAGAQDLLKKSVLSAAELDKVKSLVGGAGNLLDAIGQTDDDLEKTITSRVKDLKAKFTRAFQRKPVCQQIQGQLPIPFAMLAGDGAQVGSQADRDMNSRKLAVIGALVDLGQADPVILGYLERPDLGSLQMAEQLLAERQDGITLEALSGEITQAQPQVRFVIDRDKVRTNTPLMIKLMFNKQLYNRAAARRRIECTWDFDHDGLTEKGWEVYHYFPKAKDYHVTVKFTDVDQNPIVAGAPVEKMVTVDAQQAEASNWGVEVQRWAVGFLAAVIGLVAGAKEKIVSLDTMNAMFAIFLLGFGIDMAKNLLVPKDTKPAAKSS